MKRELREKVLNKYNSRCAYCGCKLEYEDMQVDHILAKRNGGKDDYENLNPACRLCNYHKDTFTIEIFREQLLLKVDRVLKDSNTRLLKKYGVVKFNRNPIVFYFEKTKAI